MLRLLLRTGEGGGGGRLGQLLLLSTHPDRRQVAAAATLDLIRKKMKPYQPSEKLVVRDSVSLSMDEELSDDVEDEVFIRDGRTCRTYEDRGAKRPLMAPRHRAGGKNSKSTSCGTSSPILKKYRRRRCWNCCEPFCYGLAAITVLIGEYIMMS